MLTLIAQPGVADLVEALELVEADGIAVRHDEPMEDNGEASLPEGFHLLRFAKNLRSCRNQQVLAVVRVDVVCEQALDGTGELPVEPVDENGFENGSFKENVGLPCRRVCGAGRRGGRAWSPPFVSWFVSVGIVDALRAGTEGTAVG